MPLSTTEQLVVVPAPNIATLPSVQATLDAPLNQLEVPSQLPLPSCAPAVAGSASQSHNPPEVVVAQADALGADTKPVRKLVAIRV